MKCNGCSKTTLTRQQFISLLADKHKIKIDQHSLDPIISGGFGGGYNSVEATQRQTLKTYKKVEKDRAFKCSLCGKVYCMDCLFTRAPDHVNGGKACPSCGGSFTEA